MCLHGVNGKDSNLGLVNIPVKFGAKETRQIVEDSLKKFQLDFEKHIVATTKRWSKSNEEVWKGKPRRDDSMLEPPNTSGSCKHI